MALFKRESPVEAAPQVVAPPPEPVVEEKIGEVREDFLMDIEPEPSETARQRGAISESRASVLRLQLQIADNLRQKLLAPDVPLELPLDRTPEREQQAFRALEQFVSSGNLRVPPTLTKEEFYINIMNEIFGFGPIQPLLDRDDITEVMVNSPYIVIIEKNGRLTESGYKFLDDDHVIRIIKRVVLPLGRVVMYDHPLIDARLPDGSRVNAVIPPCAIDGPNITIRKFKTVTSQNVAEVLDGVDIVALTLDGVYSSLVTAKYCQEHKIPFIEGWALSGIMNTRIFEPSGPSYEEVHGLKIEKDY